ncbi:MAG: ATP-binding protein [Methylophilaceae bacterium]
MRYIITSVAIIGIALLILLAKSLSNSDFISGDIFRFLLGLSLLFVFSLVVLIALQVFKLAQNIKKEIIGSRLTLRLVLSFSLMVIIPVSIVYLVSVNFLTKSIESWFDVRVESALEGGLTLGQKTLDILMSDIELKGKSMAYSISNTPLDERQALLMDMRAKFGIQDAVIFNLNGSINAVSSSKNSLIPPLLNNNDLLNAAGRTFFGKIEEVGNKEILLKAFVPIFTRINHQQGVLDISDNQHILMLTQPIPPAIANIALSVESVYDEYQQLTYSRSSLKIIYTLTLTLVLLLAILTSVVISFVISRKFSQPLSMLADATIEIAKGNYKKTIPEVGKDELGILVRSFNAMTHKLNVATQNAQKNRKKIEGARSFLETILTNLVTAIIVINKDKKITLYNKSASRMLDFDLLDDVKGKLLVDIIKDKVAYAPFIDFIKNNFNGDENSREEIHIEFKLIHNKKEKIIILQASPLSETSEGSYVLVIDDITMVTKAQRHLAWGEIARRLAHEIKNPLTPIQLSAERIQRKFGKKLNVEDSAILDRSTNTIVKQVNALKVMVNEFSEYARSPKIIKNKINLKLLIEEVADLYTEKELKIEIKGADTTSFVDVDENKLRQVFINIFDNAKDALLSIKNAKILVIICKKLNNILVVIEDNGAGVPEEIINRIFEPYVTSKENGTGLGLAIVHKIIDEHNGSIKIENKKDAGARITIILPIKN